MNYKEYKSTEGNLLFDLDNFVCNTIAACDIGSELNLIQLPIKLAERYASQYEKVRIQEEESKVEEYEENPDINDENQNSLESISEEINLEKIKNLCYKDMIARGYDLENKVVPIIY